MSDPVVLIAGAGPTGLVLALWLTRLGVSVRIIDKAAEPGTTSRALAVQARTLEFYHQVGLDTAVIDGGVKIKNLNFWVQAKKRAGLSLERIGAGISPYPFALIYPQDAHERLLIARLQEMGVMMERPTELLSFEQNENGVRAKLRRADGSESFCTAQFLAGCDGASSTVRELLDIGFPGGTYTGLFYVADVEAAGPPVDNQLHADVEEADFVLVFPLKGQGRLRLVGNVSDVPHGDHSKLTFDDVRAKAVEHLQLTIHKVHWFSTYRVHHRVANRFGDRRVFLLGDAAHIHSPVGGQGMNTGIADAINLAWKLAAVSGGEFPPELLDTYAQERIAFARRLVATTDRAFTFVTRRGPIARFMRTRVVPLVVPLVFRLPPMRRFLFRTLSQTTINYRSSTLSEGEAGKVVAGDRLPWLHTKSGPDNFAPLRTLHWQVHVYGEPTSALVEACAELEVAIHGFAWTPEAQRAGFERSAMYLIRPDGYVAMADKAADPVRLRAYFETRGYRWS